MGNGKYRLCISNRFDINRKRKYLGETSYCSSIREIEKKLAAFITSIDNGWTYSDSKMTLNEYSRIWLEEYVKSNLSPTTYKVIIKN